MKCPFRVNILYPGEGENWALQSWAECEGEGCPFYSDGKCARVSKWDELIDAIKSVAESSGA